MNPSLVKSLFSEDEHNEAKCLLDKVWNSQLQLEPKSDIEKIVYTLWEAAKDNSNVLFEQVFSLFLKHKESVQIFETIFDSYISGYCSAAEEDNQKKEDSNIDGNSLKYDFSISFFCQGSLWAALGLELSKISCRKDFEIELNNKYVKTFKEQTGKDLDIEGLWKKIIYLDPDSQKESSIKAASRLLKLFSGDPNNISSILKPYIEEDEDIEFFVNTIIPTIKSDINVVCVFDILQHIMIGIKKTGICQILSAIRLSKMYVNERLEEYEEWRFIHDLSLTFGLIGRHSYSNCYSKDVLFAIYRVFHGPICILVYGIWYVLLFETSSNAPLKLSLMKSIQALGCYDLAVRVKEMPKDSDSDLRGVMNSLEDVDLWPYTKLSREGKFQTVFDIDELPVKSDVGPINKEALLKGGNLALKVLINYLGEKDYLQNTTENLETFANVVFGIGEKHEGKIKVGGADKAINNLVAIIRFLIESSSSIDNVNGTNSSKNDKYNKFRKKTDCKKVGLQASNANNASSDFKNLLENFFQVDSEEEQEIQDYLEGIQNTLKKIQDRLPAKKTTKKGKSKDLIAED